jgi:hypothetical protein
VALILEFTQHAFARMTERRVRPSEVRAVLEASDIIEDYPGDTPYPSALYLGIVGGRPIHVVAAKEPVSGKTIVITLYEPAPARWDATFRRRK